MTEYLYKARDEKGKALSGRMSAATSAAVAEQLQKMGYAVVQIQPAAFLFSYQIKLPSFLPISTEDYAMFTSQLAAMLGAGLPLTAALDVLTEQTDNRRLRDAIVEVADAIKGGSSFAEALRQQSALFPTLFINMVAAGEVTGNLDEVLERFSVFIEKQAELRQKITTALFYPVILLVFSGAVVIFLSLTILPAFVKMFQDAKVPLPLPTRILYGFNQLLVKRWPWLVLSAAALGLFARYGHRVKVIKMILDRAALDLPLLGPLTRRAEIARLTRTLAALLASGVPMLQSLDTVRRTTSNSVFAGVIEDAYENVRKGGAFSEPLKASGELPAMPVKMIAVGEETGSLDKMLAKIADFYDLSVDHAVKRFSALLEPLFLVLVGGLVGFIMASVILPIFRMVSTIQH
jgi:type IV pilus assembly protein PilC